MTTAQKQRIEYLRSKGESYGAIANDLDISENTVKSYCRRNNIGVAIRQEESAVNTCANCGSPLQHTPRAKQKRFCSDQCRMAWWKAHPEAVNRKSVYLFVCLNCRKEFEAYGNKNRKYCSRACYGAMQRALP